VFCDLSTPRADGEWSAYAELRHRLVAHGVPAGEIAFIHHAKTDEARAQLFARCRSGQIAVLIGSTQKMGVGTNIHTRAVALHHLDCPWRPADIEQREGRIIRQGNQNDQVLIVRYATEGSFDVYMWLVNRTWWDPRLTVVGLSRCRRRRVGRGESTGGCGREKRRAVGSGRPGPGCRWDRGAAVRSGGGERFGVDAVPGRVRGGRPCGAGRERVLG
jgi:hypothetical protein